MRAPAEHEVKAAGQPGHTGSLANRIMAIAAGWIIILLLVGGLALDRTLTNLITRQFDDQLNYKLTALISSAEVGPDGDIFLVRSLGDQSFLEPNSGLYWQIRGQGHEDFASRSLWDGSIPVHTDHQDPKPHIFDSTARPGETLRVIERTIVLPDSNTRWWFTVAESRDELDGQIRQTRSILLYSFVILGLGLFVMAALQTWYGLGPLRRVRQAIKHMRTTGANRVTDPLPLEVQPTVEELNALLAHTERQAEEARTHAGNLAHALKTPLTVVMNAATAKAPDLADTVIREAAVMRRQEAATSVLRRDRAGAVRHAAPQSIEAVRDDAQGGLRRFYSPCLILFRLFCKPCFNAILCISCRLAIGNKLATLCFRIEANKK